MEIDKATLEQLFAEMIAINEQALSIVISALARRVDAAQLVNDLRATMEEAANGKAHPRALSAVKAALIAVHAQALVQQAQGKPHP